MRKILFFTLLLMVNFGFSQTFSNSTSVSIPDNDAVTGGWSEINVSGLNPVSEVVSVQIDISHTWDSDLLIQLEYYDDTYTLSNQNGGSGDNYTNTVFNNAASTSITIGSAPFTGTYIPEDSLPTFVKSFNPNGTWRLHVYDLASGDVGTINNWSITFQAPPCPTVDYGTLPATMSCTDSDTTLFVSDANVNGGWACPALFFEFNIDASAETTSDNTVTIYEDGSPIYSDVVTEDRLTVYSIGAYFSPSSNYTFTATDNDGTMTWLVYDENGTSYSGAFTNTTVTEGPWSPQGTSSWTCTPTNGITGTGDWGAAVFDPSSVGAGTYNITYNWDNQGTAPRHCTGSASHSVTVTNPWSAAWTSPGTVCNNGGSLNLNSYVTGDAGGTWTGSGVSGNTFNPSGLSGNIAITYTVGSSSACQSQEQHNINVTPHSTANAGSNASVCEYDSYTLSGSATNYSSVSWATSGSGTFGNASALSTTYTPSGTDITNGSVVLTLTAHGNSPCSDATSSMTLTINPQPTANAGSNASICEGETYTLSGSATNYSSVTWSTSGNGTFNASSSLNATYTPGSIDISNGSVVLTLTTNNPAGPCNAASSNMTLTVNPLPTPSISGTTTICIGESTTLTASGGSTYHWSTGSTNAAITVNPTATTSYTVTVTSTAGCSASTSKTVTVNPLPTPSISGTTTICNGDNTTLTASGGSTYHWSTGPTTAAITINPTSTTSYTVTVTSTAGCSATASQTVTVNPLPTPSISGTTTICNGDNTTLTASGGGTYNWSIGSTNSAIMVNPTSTTSYTVTVTSTAGCSASTSKTVTVNQLPNPSISGTTTICNGESTTLTASGGSTYNWSTGSTNAAITVNPTSTTSYTVTVNSAAGCSATTSQTVTVNPLPTPSISGTTAICNGESTTLTASGGGTYLWSTGPTTAAITVSPTSTTSYTVTVTSAAGCSATTSQTVTVNPLPNPSISGTTTICNGDNTTLTASGGNSYLWSNSSNFSSITVSPTATTSYSVTVTSAAGCSASASQSVTVNPLPTVYAGADQTIPNGTSTSINDNTVSPASTYTYSWTPTGSLVSGSVFHPTTTNLSTTTQFIFTTTDQTTLCTSLPDTVIITVTGGALTVSGNDDTICDGESVTLNSSTSGGSGSYTYSWTSTPVGFTSTSANPTVSPTTTTTYHDTVNDGFNTVYDDITITVNPLPTPSISGTTTICNGESTTLTASGGSTYHWSTGPTTAAITVSPTSTTSYTVTVTNASGCSTTTSQTVTVNPLPMPSISGTTTICNGESTTLTASGGSTYLWSTGPATAAITVNPTSTTSYTVTVTSAAGCSATTSQTVTVNPLPTPSITGTTTICNGDNTTLTASGGSTYHWSTGPTTAAITVNPTATTSYTVTVTSTAGCSASTSKTVTVNPLPTPSISGTTTICNGDNTTLTASGGSSYLWSNSSNSSSITVSPTATISYSVTVTSAAGCSASTSKTVTVNPLPTPSISGTTTICNGDNTTLTASGGSSYHWSTGSTNSAITVNPTSTTSYTVTVTSAAGCSAMTSKTVTVNPLPAPSISGTTTICNGESTTLTASGGGTYLWSTGPTTAAITVSPTSTTSYTVTVTSTAGCSASTSQTVTVNPLPNPSISGTTTICNGNNTTLTASGGSSYLWSNSSNSSSITVSPSATTTYSVTVTSAAGCSAMTSKTVTVNPLPAPSISGTTTICNGESTTLTASGGGTYLWSTGPTTAAITVSPTSTTSYTVTVTSAAGCSATTSQTVTVNPLPAPSITGTTTICNGNNTTLTASGGSTYHWSTGPTTAAIMVNPTSTTSYTVTVTSAAGCSATNSQTVTVNPLPTIIAGSNSPICAGEDLNLTETGNDATIWSWSGPNSFSSTSQNPTIVSAGTVYDGLYSVTGTIATTGCSATDNVDVTVNALPIVYAGADQTIANGSITTINDNTVSPAGSYFYTWTPSGSLINSSDYHPTTTNLSTTTQFIFTTTDQTTSCTSLPDTVLITVTGGPLSVSVSDDTICYGESIGLNAIASGGSGTYSYQWESNPSGFTSTFANPIVSPLATTTYSVTVNDGFNTVSEQLTTTVNPLPSVTANSNDINNTICFTDSIILYGTGNADFYTWDNSVNDSVIFSPSATQTYTVTGTTNEGCSSNDTITVTVNPLPTVGANSDDIDNLICYGDTITLTGSGADSYTWDNGIIDGIGFVPTTTQTYTVTGTTSAGCSDTDTIEITVNPLPNIDSLVTTDVTVCSTPYNGSITTYVSSGGGGFNYSFNNGSFISQNYLDTLGAGIVTVIVVDANGCQNSDSATIGTNNGLSIDSVYITDVLCHGDSSGIISIDAPSANQFSIDNGATFDTSYTFTGLPAGNYNIVVLDSGNCQAFDAVTINEPTAIQLTSNVTNYACGQLGEASVQATGGIPPYNYLWSTGDTTLDITGLQPDTFYVTVTDNHGCFESLTVIVGSNGGTAQIQTTATDVSCNGFSDGTATAVMTNGSAPYTYQWNMGDSTSTVTGLNAGTYYVTIIDMAGCAGNDTIIINEPTALEVINLPTDVSCYSYSDGSISLSVVGGTPGYSYQWNTGANTAIISSLGSGYYSVTVTDSNSCSTIIDSIYIKEPDSLYINLGNATNPFCYNGNDGSISVYGVGGTQPYSYTWNTGDSTETLNNLTAGTYFLTLTDINACQDTTIITLTNPEGMSISSDYGVDSILYQGYINLNITGGTQPYSYEWSNAATSQNLSGLSSGDYLVTITDFNGCAQTDSFNIEIPLIIPTIITPNGDSYNDTWKITNVDSYKNVHIEIYDRWGDIIYTFDGTGLEYTDISKQWDGTYNGKELPFTSYVYIVTLNDNEQVYNGVVTIKK